MVKSDFPCGILRKEAREMTACRIRPDCPSRLAPVHFQCEEVDGIKLDVRKISVFVEKDSTCVGMDGGEVVREALVMKVFDCFLQCDDVPFYLRCAPQWPLASLVGVQDSSLEC